jgi:hypothetical protein
MGTQTITLTEPMYQLVEQVLIGRTVTQTHRLYLQQALLEQTLTTGELILLDRLLYGVRRGILRMS